MKVLKLFKNLHWSRKALALILILVVLGGITMMFSTQEQQPKLSKYTEAKLKTLIEKKTGINVIKVKVNKPKGLVSVSYFEDNVFDEDSVVYIIARDAKRIMPLLFNLSGVKKVKVTEMGTFIDEQGRSNIESSASITVTKAIADEIIWDEVNLINRVELITYASELYIHPAIEPEISDDIILKAIITQMSTN